MLFTCRFNPSTARAARRLVIGAALTAISVGQLVVLAPTAQAGSVLTRFLPTRVPWNYVVESTEERDTPSDNTQYTSYMRNMSNDKAIMILSDRYDAPSWKRDASYLTDQKTKTAVIHGKRAFILESSDNNQTVTWFELGRVFTLISVNVDMKTQIRVANAVVVNSGLPTAFAVKVAPSGFSIVYTGLSEALTQSVSTMLYVSDPKNRHLHLSVEVRRIDRRYIDVYLLSPINGSSKPIVINGKAGYQTKFQAGLNLFWREEQPGLIIGVDAYDLDDTALLDVANSVTATTEDAWKAVVEQAVDFGANSDASPEILNAGMVEGQAWTVQLAAKQGCLVYTLALKPVQACVRNANSIGWSVAKLKDKVFAVGVTAANTETVVGTIDGVEVYRGAVTAVSGKPFLRLFVFPIASDGTNLSISGLDVNGKEVQAPVTAGK